MKVEAKLADISKYNTISNYSLLRNHFDGVIVRIGYRGYSAGVIKEDALFRKHIEGIIAEGLPFGFYFMSQAVTESEAIAEAEYCMSMTEKYRRMDGAIYPYYYDSELSNPSGNGRADNLNREQRTEIAGCFCNRIEQLGGKAGIYASKSWFQTNLKVEKLKAYSIWVAQYNDICTYALSSYDMWQHTSKYQIPGLSSSFDRSYCYKNFMNTVITDQSMDDVIPVREGIQSYSLTADGDKIFVIDGKKTNFKVREFRCKDGSNEIIIDSKLIDLLQTVRSHFGKAVSITSAYRTDSYNKKVGGASNSYHIKGQAADFTVTGVSNREVAKFLQSIGALGIGLYDYTGGFVHVDTRAGKYYWQQDSRTGKYYAVSAFMITVYEVKGQTVATVRYNDRNEYVKILQSELGLTVDGIFGPKTEEAVRIFQKTHSLTVDGIVGINTWNALL